jgi:hypothetical protein
LFIPWKRTASFKENIPAGLLRGYSRTSWTRSYWILLYILGRIAVLQTFNSYVGTMRSSKMQNDRRWNKDAHFLPTMCQDLSCAQDSLLEAGTCTRSRRPCKMVHLRSKSIRVLLAALVMATTTGYVPDCQHHQQELN